MVKRIPKEVDMVLQGLTRQGFEAFVVGGCVRDLLLKKEPEDWDITTNAKPEQIQNIFPDNFYENKFFTVTVLTESKQEKLNAIEVTTYRSDHKYSDGRRPGEVRYATTIAEDLSRRDFTVNAMALRLNSQFSNSNFLFESLRAPQSLERQTNPKSKIQNQALELVDLFNGKEDLEQKVIRAVGNPETRFQEDALRMMRAARLATTLAFSIEEQTKKAIQQNASLLKQISQERIRDEFVKIIMADQAMQGIELLRELGLLQYIIPELEEGYGVEQNKHHTYTVWEHNLLSLEYAAKQQWSYQVRIASLLHDIAKPRVKKGQGKESTFYDHETVGAHMAKHILVRLKASNADSKNIADLIRYHMFYYNVDEVTDSSVRRLVRKIGAENVQDLLKVRQADRIGSGVPKAEPYKFRHLKYVIDKVAQDPISSSMLAIHGDAIMKMGNLQPGPKVGHILDILLEDVLENPKNNTKKYLAKRVQELLGLADEELQQHAKKARQEREQVEIKRDETTKQKYFVQ